MFGAFDPGGNPNATSFERWPKLSLFVAVSLVGGSLAGAFFVASRESVAVADETIVEAEIRNFEVEDEPIEDEPEIEPEPAPAEPPPPSPKPVERRAKPTPQPDIQNPDAIEDRPEPGEINPEDPGFGEGPTSNERPPAPKPKQKPEQKPEPKQKPKQKSDAFPYNPDKPIERPAEATVPKQVGGNTPVYPSELESRNITGTVKVRLTIYKDGSVKGAKVLSKHNSVDKVEQPDLYAKANALLLKAVAAAVQTWKFNPSTVDGKPISVFLTVTIPFTLE